MADQRLRIIFDALNQAQGEISKLKKDIEGVNTTSNNTAKGGLTGLYEKMQAIKGQALVAGGMLAGFAVIVKKAYEFGEAGMQIQRMKEASGDLAASMGGDMDKIVSAVRIASLGTVSNMDIMSASSRAMMLGVSSDADQLANLMQVAALRGRAMGISTTQAFNDIVTGVGRMSPMILDNLGIVVDAENTFGRYAQSIGKTAEQLTSAEKRQALLNAVLAEGNKQLSAVGGLQEDAATKTEQLSAHWSNFTDRLKEWAAGPVGNVVTGLDAILFREQKLVDIYLQRSEAVYTATDGYDAYVTEMQREAEAAGYSVNVNGDLVQVYHSLYGTTERLVLANYALTESEWQKQYATDMTEQNTQELITTSQIYDDQLRRMLPNQTSVNTAIAGAGDAARGAINPVSGLHDEIYGLSTLDVNFGSQITRELDKIKFYLAGGQPLQEVTEAITTAINNAEITPQQAQELFQEAYVGAEVLKVKMGEVTADEAAASVRDELNVSLEEAKKLIDAAILNWSNFPAHIWTTLHINIQENRAGGGNGYGGFGGATMPGDYNPDTGTWEQAAGGDYLVNRPTRFTAGEYGPERVTFTPVHSSDQTISTPTVILQVENLNVNNQSDVDNLLAMMVEGLRKAVH